MTANHDRLSNLKGKLRQRKPEESDQRVQPSGKEAALGSYECGVGTPRAKQVAVMMLTTTGGPKWE